MESEGFDRLTLQALYKVILTHPPRPPQKPDTVFVLIDPDEFFLRPFTNSFPSSSPSLIRTRDSKVPIPPLVTTGSPFAQTYGLGGSWTNYDLDAITGDPNSMAKRWSASDATNKFAAGPPYIATGTDMLSIARTWSEFVRPTHKYKPGLLAEMYAWCIGESGRGVNLQYSGRRKPQLTIISSHL